MNIPIKINLTQFNEDSNELERVLVEAIKKLDLDKLKDFYTYVDGYSDYRKNQFIEDFELALSKFIELGDTFLESNLGRCGRCYKGCNGYQLIGNNTRNYLQVIFEKNGDKVLQLAECTDLKIISKIKNLKNRIYINESYDPSSEDYLAI